MNTLMIYSVYHDTFLMLNHKLNSFSEKISLFLFGIFTARTILLKDWYYKIIDKNVNQLIGDDILWADYIFIITISMQNKKS